jgi:hypothetical protein
VNQELESDTKMTGDQKQSWDLSRTNKLVEKVFGREQHVIVQPCLRSIVDRQNFAQYHYAETNHLLKDFEQRYLQDRYLLEVIHGLDEAASLDFERLMIKAGAHVTACIQAMHAIPDILASGVYLALGLNLEQDALPDRKVNITTVTQRVKRERDCCDLAALLKEVSSGATYEHIAAVSNLSKHRTVIRASLSMDMTGTREKLHEFHITSFTKPTASAVKNYPSVPLSDLFEDEYLRVGRLVIRVGSKLDEVLKLRST